MAKLTAQAAIGELSMVFQELENSLVWLFARLADPSHDTVGIIIASQLSFGRLSSVIAALVRYRTKDSRLVTRCDELLSEGHQLEQLRNTYVHSFYDWRTISGDKISYERIKHRIKPGKGFAPDYEMLDTDKVGDIIDRFRIHIAALDLYFEELQSYDVIAGYDE
jgi:hypothetical protein